MRSAIRLSAVILVLTACGDDLSGPGPELSPQPSSALVSSPISPPAGMPAVMIAPTTVYVSMPPGTDAAGTRVTVRNGSDGPSVTAPMIDGGFDPVAIVAAAGDSLVITIARPSGSAESYAKVPAQSKPVVVRTAPRHRRTDVPLNSIVRVVFNEPMDSASLVGAVRLRRGDTEIAGTVTGISVNGDILAATFEPDALLISETSYEIAVSSTARSRRGIALTTPVQAEFTTGTTTTADGTLTVTTTTTGSDLDQDGYRVTVGGATDRQGSVGTNASFSVAGVAAGLHYVALAGISQNCTPAASNIPGEPGLVREVTVEEGQSATVSFTVTCRQVGTGTLAVTTSTTGSDLDPDGYRFSVGDGPEQAIGANGTVMFPNLADTSGYMVELRGLSGNCRYADPDVFWWWGTVATNAVTTARFAIACDAITFQAGGMVAFASETPSGSAIFVSNVDGTGRVQLTDGTAQDASPTWSPDGQRLAFTRYQGGSADIYVMNADGSDQVRRTTTGYGFEPAWSPDGRRIAFGGGLIHVVDADGPIMVPSQVGTHDFWSGAPAWSPDGSRIAFIGVGAGDVRPELYVMNADGSSLRKIDLGPIVTVEATAPAWAPDGATIAVGVDDAIALVNSDGSGARIIARGWTPAWSPDGKGLAFKAPDCLPCIHYVGADGGPARPAIENGFDPAWRP